MDLIEDFPMNVRYEPEVQPMLDPKQLTCSLMSKVKCETPKMATSPQQRLHFRVSVTGRWRYQRLTSLGVSKCRNVKTQNRRITWSVGYWDFGFREMEISETHIIKIPEVPKCKNPKQAHRLEYWIL
jgi:hypothetical protein